MSPVKKAKQMPLLLMVITFFSVFCALYPQNTTGDTMSLILYIAIYAPLFKGIPYLCVDG